MTEEQIPGIDYVQVYGGFSQARYQALKNARYYDEVVRQRKSIKPFDFKPFIDVFGYAFLEIREDVETAFNYGSFVSMDRNPYLDAESSREQINAVVKTVNYIVKNPLDTIPLILDALNEEKAKYGVFNGHATSYGESVDRWINAIKPILQGSYDRRRTSPKR